MTAAEGLLIRLKMAALWVAMLFVFVYVDLFTLYRADIREALEAGRMFVFDVGEAYLLGVTLYVIIPSLMVYLSLVLRRAVLRPLSMVLAGIYLVTIVGSAVGEWWYFVLGSLVEGGLLLVLGVHAWGWREGSVQPASSATSLTSGRGDAQ